MKSTLQNLLWVILAAGLITGCTPKKKSPPPGTPDEPRPGFPSQAEKAPAEAPATPAVPGLAATFAESRKGFQTNLIKKWDDDEVPAEPPPNLLRLVHYPSPAGDLAAYVSPSPGDGKRHPVVIWKFGGLSNGIGSTAWEQQHPANDQSAGAFWKAGLLMMYPSVRGGNDNPGVVEGLYGEVDDLLAATDYLAGLDYVDPSRIYLAGHSTGGTLALLTAEAAPGRYRAVFAFGPIDEVANYGQDAVPFDVKDARECALRSPKRWLAEIQCPTFVIEGAQGNIEALQSLAAVKAPAVTCLPIVGADHFSTLGPVCNLIAGRIQEDGGPTCKIQITQADVDALFSKKFVPF